MAIRDLSSERRPVLMNTASLPQGWYALRPRDYSVIDGDTLWVPPYPRPPKGTPEARKPSFSIRMRTIAAPEKPRPTNLEEALVKAGHDLFANHPGIRVREAIKTLMRDRGALIHLSGKTDRYGRVLGDVYAVRFNLNGDYDLNSAINLERELFRRGLVDQFNKAIPLPDDRPPFDVRSSEVVVRTRRRVSGSIEGMSFY